jgi:hypothetical protein
MAEARLKEFGRFESKEQFEKYLEEFYLDDGPFWKMSDEQQAQHILDLRRELAYAETFALRKQLRKDRVGNQP